VYSPRIIAISLLTIYSLLLIFTELRTSQEYIRNYFTDISGPVLFYAVNTSLSVILFFGTALVFSICFVVSGKESKHPIEQQFYISQIVLFVYLGLDDRFLFHEMVLPLMGLNGDYVLAFLACLEVILLLKLGNVLNENNSIKTRLFFATLFGIAMFVADILLPSNLVLRLSMEDLCKTWTAFFLFLFAWATLEKKLSQLKSEVIPERNE